MFKFFNMTDQEKIRFENMMGSDQSNWWPCTKGELTLGTVIHFIYIYGSFHLAESCQVGENEVTYYGEKVATFEMSEKYKIPVFTFVEKYKIMSDNQDIFLRGLEKELHLKWREKMNHLKDFIKINF